MSSRTNPLHEYHLEAPGLRGRISALPWDSQHRSLTELIRSTPGLGGAKLVRVLDAGARLARRRVVDSSGGIAHDDHEEWAREKWLNNGCDAVKTLARLAREGYRLTEVGIFRLYFVIDHGGAASNFEQLEVEVHAEQITHVVTESVWGAPTNLQELVDEFESSPLRKEQMVGIGKPSYHLRQHVNMQAFAELVVSLAHQEREKLAKRRVTVRETVNGVHQPEKVVTWRELYPEFDKYPPSSARIFEDWDSSSLGQSGARLCDQWVLDIRDWTDPVDRVRYLSLVPRWTWGKKLPKIQHAATGEILQAKLEALDKKMGASFSWFFFALHGNILEGEAIERMIRLADSGGASFVESDYQTMRRWQDQPYAF